jgi:hypothetical protein
MMDGGGWRVQWEDGRQEMVASWSSDGESMVPYVLSDDSKSFVPASSRGEYTLSHPQQFTRAG